MTEAPRTVVDIVADGLVRHGIECEDRGIWNITYRQENMGGAIGDGFARASVGFRSCSVKMAPLLRSQLRPLPKR